MIIWWPGHSECIAKYMIYIHFTKKILETFFPHRTTARMLSVSQMFWEMLLYGGILGTFVGYLIFHTDFVPSLFFLDLDDKNGYGFAFQTAICCLFVFGETMNFACHYLYWLKS